MTIPEKVLILAAGGLLLAGNMASWKPADVGPTIAYAKRCQLGPGDSYKAAAVAVWSKDVERHPCPKPSVVPGNRDSPAVLQPFGLSALSKQPGRYSTSDDRERADPIPCGTLRTFVGF